MSIHKKIGLATIIALSLAACGGGGGSSPSTAATPTGQSVSGTTTATSSSGTAAESVDVSTIEINGNTYTVPSGEVSTLAGDSASSTIRAYRQQYSIIAGNFNTVTYGDEQIEEPMAIAQIKGQATETLPSTGSYTYNGVAFNKSETGALSYNVNFDTLKGSGSVTGLSEGTITLQEAGIKRTVDAFGTGHGIEGKASFAADNTSGDYRLKFYGPNAEEVAGTVFHRDGQIGVAGSR